MTLVLNTTLRRILLGVTAAIGAFVGLWAAAWPASFYDAFPGLGRVWIAVDGPFNEHLIRDVGALYLALAGASVAATFTRSPESGRVVGVAWTVFGLPHLIYHAAQFGGMPLIDVIGNIIGLGGSLLLGVVLMLPGPRAAHPQSTRIATRRRPPHEDRYRRRDRSRRCTDRRRGAGRRA